MCICLWLKHEQICLSTCTQIYADICIQWAKICILSQSIGSSKFASYHDVYYPINSQSIYPAICYPTTKPSTFSPFAISKNLREKHAWISYNRHSIYDSNITAVKKIRVHDSYYMPEYQSKDKIDNALGLFGGGPSHKTFTFTWTILISRIILTNRIVIKLARIIRRSIRTRRVTSLRVLIAQLLEESIKILFDFR